MEEAPTPSFEKYNQILFEKNIKLEEKEFTLQMININGDMNLFLKEINSLMNETYSNIFTLNELQKINNYFKMFDIINDVIMNLSKLIEENKYKISKRDKTVEINYMPDILIKGEIKLNLFLKEKNPNEKINDLNVLSISILKRLDNLENENLELKSKVKELTEKVEKLSNPNKNKKLFNDSLILTTETYKEKMLYFIGEKIEATELLYRGTRDGDLAKNFHERCDNKAPTIVLCKDKTGQIFGGFTKAEWDNKGKHPKYDKDAFIFSITNDKKFLSKNYENSIECNKDFGPIFGLGGDLTIYDEFLSSKLNNIWSEQKTYFDKRYDTTNNKKSFCLNELEVYLIKF